MFLFSLYFICLNFASFFTAFALSTLPHMTRIRRRNALKDCLVCIIGVIVGGHYGQGRDSEYKAFYY